MKATAGTLVLFLVCVGVIGACTCWSVAPDSTMGGLSASGAAVEEGKYPSPAGEGPEVAAAGWQSPLVVATGGGSKTGSTVSRSSATMEEFRAANRRLRREVDGLSREVDELHAERSATGETGSAAETVPVAVPAAAAEPAAPMLSVEMVRAALASAGAGEMRVALNPGNEVYLTLSGTISFASGKAELKRSAKSLVSRAVNVLKKEYPSLKVRVEGHTDSDPIRKSNWGSNKALSLARARAVADQLVRSTGLTPAQVESVGLGEASPVASNGTKEGKAQNRRCEIVLIP